jgi:hypothetical protein
LSVTHLPQIAGMASRHFLVEKEVVGDRTLVQVRALSDEERIPELARMLGGKEETAARHARELLAAAGHSDRRSTIVTERSSARLAPTDPAAPAAVAAPTGRRRRA